MKNVWRILSAISVLLAGSMWLATSPRSLPADVFVGLRGDLVNGEQVFWASGCASCHRSPDDDASGDLVLSGGYRIESPFGTFIAPNISPGPNGIEGWTTYDLANALLAGVGRDGQHLYPSLPYSTYARMVPQDVADLKAFLDTLPVSDTQSQPHEIPFPFSIRRGLGLWKKLHLKPDWVMSDAGTPELLRGRYLVEALGHCAECHTPRDATGGLDQNRWMQGAQNPSGKGTIPAISPDKLKWSAGDIAYYLESGFTPDFDSAGGQMAKVVAGTAQLSDKDRAAISAYLKALK